MEDILVELGWDRNMLSPEFVEQVYNAYNRGAREEIIVSIMGGETYGEAAGTADQIMAMAWEQGL